MIWKSTQKCGFGRSQIGDKHYIVGHYYPPGNINGQYYLNVLPLSAAVSLLGMFINAINLFKLNAIYICMCVCLFK